jgi:hypothetical protein
VVADHRFSDGLKELAHGLVKVESLLAQRAKLRGIRNRLRISDLDAVIKWRSHRNAISFIPSSMNVAFKALVERTRKLEIRVYRAEFAAIELYLSDRQRRYVTSQR